MGKPDKKIDTQREAGSNDVVIHLPPQPSDSVASVLVLEIDGPVEVEPGRRAAGARAGGRGSQRRGAGKAAWR